MQYQAITAYDIDTLNETVNEILSNGWRLQGGLSVCVDNDPGFVGSQHIYSQAMVKNVKKGKRREIPSDS